MGRVGGMIVGWLLVVPAATSLAAPAHAQPCSAERIEMAVALRHATDDRPVHITFATRADGVKLPAYLVEKYPDEMTIILQYEFDHLVVKDDRFEVGVWFKQKYARLAVPFAAVRGLWDDAVQKCGGQG
jgi:hypothetical protein